MFLQNEDFDDDEDDFNMKDDDNGMQPTFFCNSPLKTCFKCFGNNYFFLSFFWFFEFVQMNQCTSCYVVNVGRVKL